MRSESRYIHQKLLAGCIYFDADTIDGAGNNIIETTLESALVDIMLVLSDANRFRVEFYQLCQRVVQRLVPAGGGEDDIAVVALRLVPVEATLRVRFAADAQVLSQMRDNLDARDGQIERVLHRQGVRFTTMLAVAIFLSIAALVAVGVIGYLLLTQMGHS